MAKKNFATAPKPVKQPTDGQIAAYERGGTGHDTPGALNRSTSTPATTPKAKTPPTGAPVRQPLRRRRGRHRRYRSLIGFARVERAAIELDQFPGADLLTYLGKGFIALVFMIGTPGRTTRTVGSGAAGAVGSDGICIRAPIARPARPPPPTSRRSPPRARAL